MSQKTNMDFSLPKKYKLCSLKKIEQLYAKGSLVKVFPIRILYMTEQNSMHTEQDWAASEIVPFQVLFSAPKRKFKRAHDRNYIKRLLRELLRVNKQELENALRQQQKKLILSITFVGDERPEFKFLEQKFIKALHQLILELNI